jgi:hypothetical protein
MIATLPVRNQARQAFGFVEIQPGIDGIGVTGLEQALPGDRMRDLAVRHFQQRTAPFAHIGRRMMIPVVFQLLALTFGQG